jgi:hypothetical protein
MKDLREIIKTSIREYLNEQRILKENINNIDQILDKINKYGQENLTFDERIYLKQYNNNNINTDLEKWLFSDDENTFDSNGKKLLFDEFLDNEDIFYNEEKLKRVISKNLNKVPFTNNSDWGGAYVWGINSNNNFIGTFLYLDDNELVVLKRTLIDDEYNDELIKNITNSKELYSFLLSLKK